MFAGSLSFLSSAATPTCRGVAGHTLCLGKISGAAKTVSFARERERERGKKKVNFFDIVKPLWWCQ